MNYQVQTYIHRVITQATDMVDHFSIQLEPEDLYAMLCGQNEMMLNAFSYAGKFMKPGSYHDTLALPVLMDGRTKFMDVTFIVSMEMCSKYPCYLMPATFSAITPESKLYDKLVPGITLAQEWQITKDLFNRFRNLNTDQIASVLPWLKDIARDAVSGMDSTSDIHGYLRRYGLPHMTTTNLKTFRSAMERLASPGRATNTPALTSKVNQLTLLGNKLFGQWRMLRNKPATTPEGTFVAIAITDTLLPDWYKEDMEGILTHWQEEENTRAADRTYAKRIQERTGRMNWT